MNVAELSQIQAYHLDRLIEFGPGTPGALGWKGEEDHSKRLEIFCQLGDFSGQTVLDVGCGYGDLYEVLAGRFADFCYAGVDQMQPFLDVAIGRYGGVTGVTFELGDFTADPLAHSDYVIASGALCYRSGESDFIFNILKKLFTACRVGLGFNLLSSVDFTEGVLVAYDQASILAYCHTLSSRVELRPGSVGDDFTVFLYK